MRKAIVWTFTICLLLSVVVTPGALGHRSAPSGSARLTNLAHLDFLGDRVTPPSRSGHTTYGLDAHPSVRTLWTYAEPDGSGGYKRIGGGVYDPATNTYGQGAFNTDDMTRAAVAYIRHWQRFGDAHSKAAARGLLRTVAYMQTLTRGPKRGNFVLWMQPDGRLNPSADPVELPDPSDSGPSYWLARGIWALGEGYAAFKSADPGFASFLRRRLDLAVNALERQVLVRYGETQTVDGLSLPAWLIVDGADASSEAVYGLSAYVEASGDTEARAALRRLADGIARMRVALSTEAWPFGAIFPWALSRSVWHAWADQMSGSLVRASEALGDPSLVSTAVGEAGTFTPHVLAQGGSDQGWLPSPSDRSQIAYGADATLQNLLRVADATGRSSFRRLAGIQAAWYFGNNPAGARMYDPSTGRTFDGVNSDATVNQNSGAESTIHGLLSMLALDSDPFVKDLAMRAARVKHATWEMVEAEDGALSGDAVVVTPDDPWTGESLWSGGGYVSLGRGASVVNVTSLPIRDHYRLLPVFHRLQVRRRAKGTRHRLEDTSFGISWHGGAGAQGVTPWPGYLDIDDLASQTSFGSGSATLKSSHVGSGGAVELDGVLVQPEIEQLVLSGADGVQGLLRSWSEVRRTRTVGVAGSGALVARAYDRQGRFVEMTVGAGGSVVAPIAPGGFTLVSSR